MRHLIYSLLLGLLVMPSHWADANQGRELDLWARTKLDALNGGCDKIKRKDWSDRYSQLSVEVMQKVKELSSDEIDSAPQDSTFKQFLFSVYTQHVPDQKRKHAPNPCFVDLQDYMKSNDSAVITAAKKKFETCNEYRYGGKLPKPVYEVVRCWKKIRD